MWSNWNCHIVLVGMQNGAAILKNSLAGSYKAKLIFIILIQKSHSWVLVLPTEVKIKFT